MKKDWKKPDYELFEFSETQGASKNNIPNREDYFVDEFGNFVPNTLEDPLSQGPS